MVQRYDLIVDDLRQMVESEDGYFVEYGDYERLKQEFMDYVVIKEKEIAYLNAMLEVADDNR